MGFLDTLKNKWNKVRDNVEGKFGRLRSSLAGARRSANGSSNLSADYVAGTRRGEDSRYDRDVSANISGTSTTSISISDQAMVDVMNGNIDTTNLNTTYEEIDSTVTTKMAEENADLYIKKINKLVEAAANNGVFLKSKEDFDAWLDANEPQIRVAIASIFPGSSVEDLDNKVEAVKSKLTAIWNNDFYKGKRTKIQAADEDLTEKSYNLFGIDNADDKYKEAKANRQAIERELLKRRITNGMEGIRETSRIKNEAAQNAEVVVRRKYAGETTTAEDGTVTTIEPTEKSYEQNKYKLVTGGDIDCVQSENWNQNKISLKNIKELLSKIKTLPYTKDKRIGFSNVATAIKNATGISWGEGTTCTWKEIESYLAKVVTELEAFEKNVEAEVKKEAKMQEKILRDNLKNKAPKGKATGTLEGKTQAELEDMLKEAKQAEAIAKTAYDTAGRELDAAIKTYRNAENVRKVEADRVKEKVSIEIVTTANNDEDKDAIITRDVIITAEKERISANRKESVGRTPELIEAIYLTAAHEMVNSVINYALDPSSIKAESSFRDMAGVNRTAKETEENNKKLCTTVNGAFKDLGMAVDGVKDENVYEENTKTIVTAQKALSDCVERVAISIAAAEGRTDDKLTAADKTRAVELINGKSIEITTVDGAKTINENGAHKTVGGDGKEVETQVVPMYDVQTARMQNEIIEAALATTFATASHRYNTKMLNEIKVAEFTSIEETYTEETTEVSILKEKIRSYIDEHNPNGLSGKFASTEALLENGNVTAAKLRKTFLKELKDRESFFGPYSHHIGGRELGKKDIAAIESDISKIDVEAERKQIIEGKKDEIANARVENDKKRLVAAALKYQVIANGAASGITRVVGTTIKIGEGEEEKELDLTKISSFTPEQLESLKEYMVGEYESSRNQAVEAEKDGRKMEAERLNQRAQSMGAIVDLIDDTYKAQNELQVVFNETAVTEELYGKSAINALFAEDGTLNADADKAINDNLNEQSESVQRNVTADQIKNGLINLRQRNAKPAEENREEHKPESTPETPGEKKDEESKPEEEKPEESKPEENKKNEEEKKTGKKQGLAALSLAKYGKVTDAATRFVKAKNAVQAMITRQGVEKINGKTDLKPMDGTVEVAGYSGKTTEEIRSTSNEELAKDPSVMEDLNFIVVSEALIQTIIYLEDSIEKYKEANKSGRGRGQYSEMIRRLQLLLGEMQEAESSLKDCFNETLSAKARAKFIEEVCKKNGSLARNFRGFFEVKDGKIVFTDKIKDLSKEMLDRIEKSVVISLTPEGIIGGVKSEAERSEAENKNVSCVEEIGQKDGVLSVAVSNHAAELNAISGRTSSR